MDDEVCERDGNGGCGVLDEKNKCIYFHNIVKDNNIFVHVNVDTLARKKIACNKENQDGLFSLHENHVDAGDIATVVDRLQRLLIYVATFERNQLLLKILQPKFIGANAAEPSEMLYVSVCRFDFGSSYFDSMNWESKNEIAKVHVKIVKTEQNNCENTVYCCVYKTKAESLIFSLAKVVIVDFDTVGNKQWFGLSATGLKREISLQSPLLKSNCLDMQYVWIRHVAEQKGENCDANDYPDNDFVNRRIPFICFMNKQGGIVCEPLFKSESSNIKPLRLNKPSKLKTTLSKSVKSNQENKDGYIRIVSEAVEKDFLIEAAHYCKETDSLYMYAVSELKKKNTWTCIQFAIDPTRTVKLLQYDRIPYDQFGGIYLLSSFRKITRRSDEAGVGDAVTKTKINLILHDELDHQKYDRLQIKPHCYEISANSLMKTVLNKNLMLLAEVKQSSENSVLRQSNTIICNNAALSSHQKNSTSRFLDLRRNSLRKFIFNVYNIPKTIVEEKNMFAFVDDDSGLSYEDKKLLGEWDWILALSNTNSQNSIGAVSRPVPGLSLYPTFDQTLALLSSLRKSPVLVYHGMKCTGKTLVAAVHLRRRLASNACKNATDEEAIYPFKIYKSAKQCWTWLIDANVCDLDTLLQDQTSKTDFMIERLIIIDELSSLHYPYLMVEWLLNVLELCKTKKFKVIIIVNRNLEQAEMKFLKKLSFCNFCPPIQNFQPKEDNCIGASTVTGTLISDVVPLCVPKFERKIFNNPRSASEISVNETNECDESLNLIRPAEIKESIKKMLGEISLGGALLQLNGAELLGICTETGMKNFEDFHSDFIFFHMDYGITLINIKVDMPNGKLCICNTVEKLNQTERMIKRLFQHFIGKKYTINLTKIIGLPFYEVENEKGFPLKLPHDTQVFCKDAFNSSEALATAFRQLKSKNKPIVAIQHLTDLLNFLAILVGRRLVEFAARKRKIMQACQLKMLKSYPNYRSEFFQHNVIPICIPPCLDGKTAKNSRILDMNKVNKHGQQVSTKGQEAEDVVLNAFRETDIGGLLLQLNGTELCDACTETGMENFEDFEMDFVFFNGQYGMTLMEVKGGTPHGNLGMAKGSASEQLERTERMIKKLFKHFLGKEDFSIKLTKIICFPFYEQSSASPRLKGPRDEHVFCKDAFGSGEMLTAAFKKIHDGSESTVMSENSTDLLDFMTLVVGQRPIVFVSQGGNALYVCQLISSQRVKDGKQLQSAPRERVDSAVVNLKFHECNDQNMFLLPSQQEILESDKSQQIIYGPPGTGKTVLLMLKIKMEAERENRTNRIRVYSRSVPLRHKLQLFINKLKLETRRREPEVILDLDNLDDADDLFADEEILDVDTYALLRKRKAVAGKTIIAVTGCRYPIQINETKTELDTPELADIKEIYDVRELRDIMRNSKNIIDCFKGNFPRANIGHIFKGESIIAIRCSTVDMPAKLFAELKKYLNDAEHPGSSGDDRERKLQGRDIAIITQDKELKESLTAFLRSKHILCGTVIEQLLKPYLIAVDEYLNTLSFDWPIVFAYGYADVRKRNDTNYAIIAASRAVAKLVTVYSESENENLRNANEAGWTETQPSTVSEMCQVAEKVKAVYNRLPAKQKQLGRRKLIEAFIGVPPVANAIANANDNPEHSLDDRSRASSSSSSMSGVFNLIL